MVRFNAGGATSSALNLVALRRALATGVKARRRAMLARLASPHFSSMGLRGCVESTEAVLPSLSSSLGSSRRLYSRAAVTSDRVNPGATTAAPSSLPQKADVQWASSGSRVSDRDAWIYRDVKGAESLQVIEQRTLAPSESRVSSAAEAQVICSYNWRDCSAAQIVVPGSAPKLQIMGLPVTLPQDRGYFFHCQNAARVPRQPLEPLFRAATVANPHFRFNDVDVVISRNSLVDLLDFCGGRIQQAFQLKLSMVRNSLLVEGRARRACFFTSGDLSGYGRNFERVFTRHPSEMRDCTEHFRVLLYRLGHLRCAVSGRVDARYEGEDDATTCAHPGDSSQSREPEIICRPRPASKRTRVVGIVSNGNSDMAPQSTAATVKVIRGKMSPTIFMPQLWFGRTPWLIHGRHTDGTFVQVSVSNVAHLFPKWERQRQDVLRKLVSLLDRLKDIVGQFGGRPCFATCAPGLSTQRSLNVYASTDESEPLPDDLIAHCWSDGEDAERRGRRWAQRTS